ncbi:hypothetical protein K439DRAFT_554957 [Ramaria rubella]|nr:hypothetical protein K439DRAFT_554957 [Ramaria rubella]
MEGFGNVSASTKSSATTFIGVLGSRDVGKGVSARIPRTHKIRSVSNSNNTVPPQAYAANLSELSFLKCSIEASFFSTLCWMTPQAFSQLESIRLQGCRFSVSDLAHFIQSKCPPGGAARSCRVHIASPRGMSNDEILDLKHLKDTHGHTVSCEGLGDDGND